MTELAYGPPTRRSSKGLSALWRFATEAGWTRRIGIIGVAALILAAMLGPIITPYSSSEQSLYHILQPPSTGHWLGTDQLGRDELTRVLYAARVDLMIGFIGVTVPLIIGTSVGLVAGYLGGWVDALIGRVIDVFTAFPFFVLVIAIVAMLGPGLRNLYIAIFIVSWVAYARIVRGETLSAKRREYVMAAQTLGYTRVRIMFRHLLPNVIVPAIVFGMSDFVLDIVVGASVGYFGLGVQPPQAEWGAMIGEGRNFISTAPWLALAPGGAIIATGLVFSLLGDGVADYVRGLDRNG
jgi:peptide/nickel transport system permease protein